MLVISVAMFFNNFAINILVKFFYFGKSFHVLKIDIRQEGWVERITNLNSCEKTNSSLSRKIDAFFVFLSFFLSLGSCLFLSFFLILPIPSFFLSLSSLIFIHITLFLNSLSPSISFYLSPLFLPFSFFLLFIILPFFLECKEQPQCSLGCNLSLLVLERGWLWSSVAAVQSH